MQNVIDDWYMKLQPIKINEPEDTVIVCTDMVNGFCHEGPLASPRVKALIPGIVDFLETSLKSGVSTFLFFQDSHTPDAHEFDSYPAHCVEGSTEADMIPEIENFYRMYGSGGYPTVEIIRKNTLLATDFFDPEGGSDLSDITFYELIGVKNWIVIGNCTDLCIYANAMQLNQFLQENGVREITGQVVVPDNLVDTYDLPGIHDGDFFHKTFLYHMAQNGIKVAESVVYKGRSL